MSPDLDRSRTAWTAVGAALGVALLFVLYSFIGTFVFGVFVYYATRPVYRRLRTRVYPPSLAAALSILLLALPAVLMGAFTLAVGLNQLEGFLEGQGEQFEALQGLLDPYFDISAAVQDPGMLLENPDVVSFLRGGLDAALSYAGLVGNGLLHLFVMLALAFYLLRDGPRLSRWAIGRFGDNRGVLDRYLAAVDRDFSSIFFGNILNAIITGVIGALVYTALDVTVAPAGLGIPYAPLVGLLTGAGSLVPVIGMKIVYVPVALWLALQSLVSAGTETLWFVVVFVLVSFVVVDVVPDLGLRPYVSGRHIHTGAIMFAYILGPLLFGWYGLFLGPILLVLVVHFARVVVPALVAERHFAPYSVDPTYLDRVGAGSSPVVSEESTDGASSVPGEWVSLSDEESLDADGSSTTDPPDDGDSGPNARRTGETTGDESGTSGDNTE